MERGEGSKKVPDFHMMETIRSFFKMPSLRLSPVKEEPIDQNDDLLPLQVVRPLIPMNVSNNMNSLAVSVPVRRGPGRPKGSKNMTERMVIPFPPTFIEPNTRNMNDRRTEVVRPSPPLLNAPASDAGALKRGAGRSNRLQSSTAKKLKMTVRPITPPSTRYILSQEEKETGNRDLVKSLLMRFEAIRRRLSETEVQGHGVFVAINTFKSLELFTNSRKRFGPVPGVNVGDIFYLWGEMGIVGLHVAPIGVEFMRSKEINANQNTMALCIVSSGKNADVSDDIHTLTYKGLGGTAKFNNGKDCDQTLGGMNFGLETTMKVASPVRVVRSKPDRMRTIGNIYIYDGIYLIKEMWEERAENGFKVFKFKLEREPDQKPAFEIWKSVEQWRNGLVPRPGLLLQDLSNGAEKLKVFLVNEVDEEKSPEPFQYVTSLKHPVLNIPSLVDCCNCIRSLTCSRDCSCVRRNFGNGFPYVEGALVTRTPMIYECGGSCHCTDECKNKMIHSGIKFSLEVFKTVECGWGLRSWDPIRAGSFICQYAGDITPKSDVEEDDDYIFDTTRVYKPFEGNYEPELVGEDAKERVFETLKSSAELVISAKRSGNVARFMNHSCDPNVFWQLISREEHGVWCMYIGLFAKMHIPPLTELRYDYGTSSGGKEKKICLCRSEKCSGTFG